MLDNACEESLKLIKSQKEIVEKAGKCVIFNLSIFEVMIPLNNNNNKPEIIICLYLWTARTLM